DFNAVLDPRLDVSGDVTAGRSARATGLKSWADSLGLCEVWRTWHPMERQYT
ncbi:hypothetical protein NDU88_000141, partial [Pleurodeles waltl]